MVAGRYSLISSSCGFDMRPLVEKNVILYLKTPTQSIVIIIVYFCRYKLQGCNLSIWPLQFKICFYQHDMLIFVFSYYILNKHYCKDKPFARLANRTQFKSGLLFISKERFCLQLLI